MPPYALSNLPFPIRCRELERKTPECLGNYTVTRHAKYVTFQLAEVAITRKLFAAILDRIERLALPPLAIHGG